MRTQVPMLLCLALLGACREAVESVPEGFCAQVDLKVPDKDMALPSPKCPAAKGLAGDNLLCFDFSSLGDQTLTTPPPSQLNGWDFEQFAKSCWQILGGKLQVKSFASFTGSCGFLMPALLPSDYQKYNTFTLAIVQTLDINSSQQRMQVLMGLDDPVTRLVDWATGSQPHQQRIYSLAKNALPNGGSNSYQPLFKLTSSLAGGATGWQIESIAINATQ